MLVVLKSYCCALRTDLKTVRHFNWRFLTKCKCNTVALNVAMHVALASYGLQILQLPSSTRRPRQPSTGVSEMWLFSRLQDARAFSNIHDARLIAVKLISFTLRGSWSTYRTSENDIATVLCIKHKTVRKFDESEVCFELRAVFSERELKFMFAICRRPSVCLSSVCL